MPYLPKIPDRLRPRFELWADKTIARWPNGVRRNARPRKSRRMAGPLPPLSAAELKALRATLEHHFIVKRGWVEGDGTRDGTVCFHDKTEWRP